MEAPTLEPPRKLRRFILRFIAAAYIVSRGLAKVGTDHHDPEDDQRS